MATKEGHKKLWVQLPNALHIAFKKLCVGEETSMQKKMEDLVTAAVAKGEDR